MLLSLWATLDAGAMQSPQKAAKSSMPLSSLQMVSQVKLPIFTEWAKLQTYTVFAAENML